MLAGMRSYAQALANRFMETPVTIRHRNAPGKDPANKSGDDIEEFSATTTSALGWFVDPSTATFQGDGGMMSVVDKPTLRLPVGTDIESRDEVTINGDTWIVIDASVDDTWPAMLKCALVRQH